MLDVDGVLTDGRLCYGPEGEIDKVFHVRDGHGIKALLAAGVRVAVISGRDSPAVTRRCAELGIADVLQGVSDKAAAFAALTARLGIDSRAAACVGDDTPDVDLMRRRRLAPWRSRTRIPMRAAPRIGARAWPAAPARCARCATGCWRRDGSDDEVLAPRGGGADAGRDDRVADLARTARGGSGRQRGPQQPATLATSPPTPRSSRPAPTD